MPLAFRPRFAALTVAAAVLAGCSPVFNWREVPIADDGLVALLPCKPDRVTRQLPLGGNSVSVAVDMTGCEAGGATFAVAHASAEDAAQAERWMQAWRAAARGQLAGAAVVETSSALPRAAGAPSPMRLDVPQGVAGSAAPAHMLWFAQERPGKVALYQATVLGRPASAEALGTFFEGLRLP